MTRLLLFLLAVSWVARFLARLKIPQDSHSPPPPGGSPRPLEHLTRCERCGTYFPSGTGVGPGGSLCSSTCRSRPG
ncbi:MAG TPA: hypothetical protein VF017_19520 [Thermoanaerobaculia bacterium]|nr:hypothetical protein [Thermoanaerobaculia bacterium]